MDIAKPMFPWVGGKERLIPMIRQVMPSKMSQYMEPFGGSGANLLGMPPERSRLDIYNDYNQDLVNFFLCARDRPRPSFGSWASCPSIPGRSLSI